MTSCCQSSSHKTSLSCTTSKDEAIDANPPIKDEAIDAKLTAKRVRRTPYIRWFGVTHPDLPPAGTAPSVSIPMVNPIPVALGISADNKAKHMRNPRVHLVNAARHDPLNPDRQAILMTITACTSQFPPPCIDSLSLLYCMAKLRRALISEEPTPSFEAGKITFWFSLSIPYRKDLLIQLVGLGVIEYTGWKLSDPPALEVRLLLRGDQCSRPCCGCGDWEQLDEPDKETGKRRYSRLLRCSGCLQCFFCSKKCQTRKSVSKFTNVIESQKAN